MKTIAEIAKELGVSRQSVYARVKESGVNLDKLTKERIGKQTFFDDDAVKVIMSACQKERVKKERVKDDNKTRQDELTKQIETLTRELEEARSKIMEDQAEIARLRAIEEDLTKQIETLTRELEEARSKIMEDQQEIARLRAIEEEQRHTISSQAETIRIKTQQEAMRLEAQKPEKVGIFSRIIKAISGKKE